MRRWTTCVLLALAVALVAAGCREEGSDGDADGDADGDGDGDGDADVEGDGDLDGDGDDGDGDAGLACEPGTRDGAAGSTDGLRTERGIAYNVRAPLDYEPTTAYPLIVVYAPAGGDEELTEEFTRLTPVATEAGFVIAYADHRSPTSMEIMEEFGTIPALVAERWCIDESRIYMTGHSDGGSVASVIALEESILPRPAAIAPSAAGVNGEFLATVACPTPLSVMVIHSSGDTLFPGFGAQAVAWWADCFGCDATRDEPLADGCEPHPSCEPGVEVLYCEVTGAHGRWPSLNDSIIDFFLRH